MMKATSVVLLVVCVFITLCNAALNCPTLPPHAAPTNVTQLRPGDIKVVMAMGDSITAGFGIQGSKGQLNESRGLSASIGGDTNAVTLANFLRFYSPNLQGPSLGQHIVELCEGALCPPLQYHPAQDVLNSAQSGALLENLVTHELDYLISQLKVNHAINIKEDWKVLTIFIGANDLCSSCTNKTYVDPGMLSSIYFYLLFISAQTPMKLIL
jgi:phospholipase B1